MNHKLFQLALVIDDYDEAISYYTDVLQFELVEDTRLSDVKRWVVVKPGHDDSCRILLAKAKNKEQATRIGNQTGGRVFLFLSTEDLEGDYVHLQSRGVDIIRGPVIEPFGKVLVFRDRYGNLWDLIQPK